MVNVYNQVCGKRKDVCVCLCPRNLLSERGSEVGAGALEALGCEPPVDGEDLAGHV